MHVPSSDRVQGTHKLHLTMFVPGNALLRGELYRLPAPRYNLSRRLKPFCICCLPARRPLPPRNAFSVRVLKHNGRPQVNARLANPASEKAQAEAEAEESDDDERWMSSSELEDFSGNWMDIARRRTGRTVSGLSAASARGRADEGTARDVGGPPAQRPTLALQSNVSKWKMSSSEGAESESELKSGVLFVIKL